MSDTKDKYVSRCHYIMLRRCNSEVQRCQPGWQHPTKSRLDNRPVAYIRTLWSFANRRIAEPTHKNALQLTSINQAMQIIMPPLTAEEALFSEESRYKQHYHALCNYTSCVKRIVIQKYAYFFPQLVPPMTDGSTTLFINSLFISHTLIYCSFVPESITITETEQNSFHLECTSVIILE